LEEDAERAIESKSEEMQDSELEKKKAKRKVDSGQEDLTGKRTLIGSVSKKNTQYSYV